MPLPIDIRDREAVLRAVDRGHRFRTAGFIPRQHSVDSRLIGQKYGPIYLAEHGRRAPWAWVQTPLTLSVSLGLVFFSMWLAKGVGRSRLRGDTDCTGDVLLAHGLPAELGWGPVGHGMRA